MTAVITIEGDAALAASETATHVLGDLAGSGSDTTSWTLECTGSGPVTITVTPAGTDANTGMPAPAVADAVTVNQVDKAHLAVTVDAPEDVTVGDEFLITATVANTGQAAAMDVSAALSIAGNAALVSGDLEKDAVPSTLPGSGSVEITWSLRCTGGGAVTLTVTPAGTDENTGVAIPGANLESGSATVDQWYMLFAPIIARGYTP